MADATAGLRIAGFDFDESELLAELYAQIVEEAGIPVIRLGAVGPREVVNPALVGGVIDLVPEYLGTASRFAGVVEPARTPLSAVEELADLLAPSGVTVLDAAPAEDVNVFVVSATTAESAGLVRVSDLAGIGLDRFGGPPECRSRPLCLVGLETIYDLTFAEFVPQPSLMFTAESLRRDEIDVGLLFSTAPELEADDLVALEDDRAMQPPENIVPMIRLDALERWGPSLATALNRASARLTTVDLRVLNRRVADGESPAAVARAWLVAQELAS